MAIAQGYKTRMIKGFSSQRKLRTYSMSCINGSTVQNQSCNKTRDRIHHHYLDFICNYLWSMCTYVNIWL